MAGKAPDSEPVYNREQVDLRKAGKTARRNNAPLKQISTLRVPDFLRRHDVTRSSTRRVPTFCFAKTMEKVPSDYVSQHPGSPKYAEFKNLDTVRRK
jgi:hypothetical protein